MAKRGSTETQGSSAAKKHKDENVHHEPVGKDGEGFYSAATLGCFSVVANASPLLLARVPEICAELSKSKEAAAFQIADFGTADAGTSMGLMHDLCKSIREQPGCKDREIQVHYEDQPMNEWKSVFRHCLGEIEIKDAHGKRLFSPFNTMDGVFFTGIGESFYAQNVPSNTISLGMSFTAMHWLSEDPKSMAGHPTKCHVSQLTKEEKKTAKAQGSKVMWGEEHAKQSATDWERIMLHRLQELRPGGVFVCINFTHTEDGHFLGNGGDGVQSMYDNFAKCWGKMGEEGKITAEEVHNLSFPNYYRTKEECMAPFAEGGKLAKLAEVLSVETKKTQCPFRSCWLKAEKGETTNMERMTKEQHARWFVPTTQTWSNSTFVQALSPTRKEEEKKALVTQFWEKYIGVVAEKPQEHAMDYFHTYIVLRKKAA